MPAVAAHRQSLDRPVGTPRLNDAELVMVTVAGRVAPPLFKTSPYRIGRDGVLRVVPGAGGVTLTHRVGDLCVGLAADHVEPGVSIRSELRSTGGQVDGANLALNTLACIGNRAIVTSGPAVGARGVVTGKHGGIENVILDFPDAVMRRLRIGDQIQVYALGQGSRLLDHASIVVMNAAPRLLRRWGLRRENGRLLTPITHCAPAATMGSGLGKSFVARGDFDLQLADPRTVARYRLGSLRFGDMVAVLDADSRFGRSFERGRVTVGVVVHSDSTAAGHGPGVVSLLTGPADAFILAQTPAANLAMILKLRPAVAPRRRQPLVLRHERHIDHTAVPRRKGTA